MLSGALAALLPSALVGLWAAVVWRLWVRSFAPPRSVLHPARIAGLAGVCLVAVVLGAPSLWLAALGGYAGDSFYTLDPAARAGLIVLSAALVLALWWTAAAKSVLLHRLAGARSIPAALAALADVLASLVLLALAVGLAPQLYYAYYRIVIPGLPAQWVVREWFDWQTLLRVAALSPDASLSDHLTGITFWVVMLMALGWPVVLRSREAGHGRPSAISIGLAAAVLCLAVHTVLAWWA